MLLAHTRGLLKPDYRFGIKSRIRESLVLAALADEIEGNVLLSRAVMETAVIPFVEASERNATFSKALEFLQTSWSKCLLEPGKPKATSNISRGDTQEMISLLDILQSTEYSSMMERKLNES